MLPLLIHCFSSCMSIKEEIHIKKNGSGSYTTAVDLGKMMNILQLFSTEITGSLNGESEHKASNNKDTTISLKAFTDTNSVLSADEKKLLETGSLHVMVNEEAGLYKISATVPFSSLEDMAAIAISNGKKSLLDIMFRASKSNSISKNEDNTPPPFEMECEAGRIERKFIPELYEILKEEMKSSENDEIIKKMFEGNNFTTIMHFEQAIKKAEGKYTLVSEDGKTVTIDIPFLDMINNPKDITYRIDY